MKLVAKFNFCGTQKQIYKYNNSYMWISLSIEDNQITARVYYFIYIVGKIIKYNMKQLITDKNNLTSIINAFIKVTDTFNKNIIYKNV